VTGPCPPTTPAPRASSCLKAPTSGTWSCLGELRFAGDHDAESRIVEPARKKGMGVIGMKVLGGDGQLADDYDRALRYTLSVPGVACAIVGVANAEQVRPRCRPQGTSARSRNPK